MKAAVFEKTGGPEVLEWREIAEPVPGPDDVLIRTKAVGLNFADINRRRGIYPVEPPSPFVLGYEGAGVVVAVGDNVRDLLPGARVAFAHVPRANAELVRAPAWKVVPLPSAISFETAAAVMLQGLTAHYLTHDSAVVKAGDTVLVHSASGGVGLLLVQICHRLGACVIGTVSHVDKIAAARAAGADEVIVRTASWQDAVRNVDIVYDSVGTTLVDSLAAARARGTVVYFGQSGGPPPAIDPNLLMEDSKRLVGGELWSHVADRAALLKRTETLFRWIIAGDVVPSVITTYPLSRIADAHRAMESGTTQGKQLLLPN